MRRDDYQVTDPAFDIEDESPSIEDSDYSCSQSAPSRCNSITSKNGRATRQCNNESSPFSLRFNQFPSGHTLSVEDIDRMSKIWDNAVLAYLEIEKPTPSELFLFRRRDFTVKDVFPSCRTEWTLAQGSKERNQKFSRLFDAILAQDNVLEWLTDWGKNMVRQLLQAQRLTLLNVGFSSSTSHMGISGSIFEGISRLMVFLN